MAAQETMRLGLVISSLGCGGAERVTAIMANYWAERGERVAILTLDGGESPFYRFHPEVTHRALGLPTDSRNVIEGLVRNIYRIVVLRRAIRDLKPAVVISFMDKTNVLTILATQGLGIPLVISERIDPALYDIGRLWAALRRLTYPLADALVCQTSSALPRFPWFKGAKAFVIPNPVLLPRMSQQARARHQANGKQHLIVAMGRLSKQKGYDLLLDAFRAVSGNHPDWSLAIMGDGPLRRALEEQVRALELCGRVSFLGLVSDPFGILQQADLFVLSSRFEGFPNALTEAMACGLPVISFDCPSGPREIIRNGVDGVLVPPENVNALAAVLDRLIRDAAERERLAKHAPEVVDRFGVERVMGMWNQLIKEILK